MKFRITGKGEKLKNYTIKINCGLGSPLRGGGGGGGEETSWSTTCGKKENGKKNLSLIGVGGQRGGKKAGVNSIIKFGHGPRNVGSGGDGKGCRKSSRWQGKISGALSTTRYMTWQDSKAGSKKIRGVGGGRVFKRGRGVGGGK